jgi:hypothetical protein
MAALVNVTKATSLSITIPATTQGNCLVVTVMVNNNGGSTGSVSGITLGGSAGNFALAKAQHVTNGISASADVIIWTDQSCAGGQTAIVISGSNLTLIDGIAVYEFSGVLPSLALDKTTSSSGTSTSYTSGATATLSQPAEIAVGAIAASSANVTAPAVSWIDESSGLNNTCKTGYQITSSTNALTYNGSMTSDVWAAAVITLKTTVAGTSSSIPAPFSLTSPYPLNMVTGSYGYTPQHPANYPNTYIQGITATDTVVANTGTPTVNRSGLASAVTSRSFFGNIAIQPNYSFQAPFPVSLPYPMNLNLGSYRVQPRFNTNVAVPTIAVFGLTANVNVAAPNGGAQITTAGVYSLQFPFASNTPYPLNIISKIKPQHQGQPLAYVAVATANVVVTAPMGSIVISKNLVSHEVVTANFGGLFIQGKVQPSYPFTNFPLPLKLHNLRPVYSSGKIQFPTVVFGVTANESVASIIGTVEIGKHVPGFVSNNFAASLPGIVSISVPKNASNVNAIPHAPSARTTFAGTVSSASSAAHSGIVTVRELGITVNVNANPEFGSVHIGHSVLGITATVTVAPVTGSPKISISEHANVSAASSVHISVSKAGNVSAVSASSRFGTVNIFKSLHSNVAVASVAGIKVSPSLSPARVSAKANARTVISVPVAGSQVIASSTAGTRTTIGETAMITVSSPVGVTKVIISSHVSGVAATAPNEGKVINGITSSVTATAHMGSAVIRYSNTARTSVNAYLGEAGTSHIDARIIARLNNFRGF